MYFKDCCLVVLFDRTETKEITMKTSELINQQPLESGGDLITGFCELNYTTLLRLNPFREEREGGWEKDCTRV